MKPKKIRLRYAPSPTGFLHIGNTRTALFNYIWAKHYDGDFILRIEDTDVERNVEGAIESQLDNLRWLGIFPDETIDQPGSYGPYRQLERLEIYQNYANQLIKNKKAYYCFCTTEELEKMRSYQLAQGYSSFRYDRRCLKLSSTEVQEKINNKEPYNIRFFVPDNHQYIFDDVVRGNVSFNSKDIGDWVILKSNQIPTYNFAVAVDDYLMLITHVIRGEEHISNTPKQIMIYEAFNWPIPKFAHLTLIINENHKKLSKRDKDIIQFIEQYRNLGFLPQAIFNYVALLGWSPPGTNEFFTPQELIQQFDEHRLSKSPSMFDMKKMTWMNNYYIKNLSDEEYLSFVKPFALKKYPIEEKSKEWITMLLLIYKRELQYGEEIVSLISPFFSQLPLPKFSTLTNLFNLASGIKIIIEFLLLLDQIPIFNEENIKKIITQIGQTMNVKGKDLYMPIRIFASYQSHGPELAKVIFLLGKDQVITNIERLLSECQQKG